MVPMDIFYMCLFCKYLNSLCGYVKQNAELSPKLLEKSGKNCKSCFMPYFIDSREPLATAFAKWLVSHFEMELSSTPPSACATVIVPTHTAAELLRGGYSADTPAAIVYKASWPEERTYTCTVGTLAETAQREGISKTALIVVGQVLGQAYDRSLLYHPAFTHGCRQAAPDEQQYGDHIQGETES